MWESNSKGQDVRLEDMAMGHGEESRFEVPVTYEFASLNRNGESERYIMIKSPQMSNNDSSLRGLTKPYGQWVKNLSKNSF